MLVRSSVGRGILSCRLSVELFRHCLLSGGTQRLALHQHQNEEIKLLNISCPRVGMESTTIALTVATSGVSTDILWWGSLILYQIGMCKRFFPFSEQTFL